MKGLSKEVKSAIIIGVVIVLLLILGIIYGQKEKTEVADTPTTTVSEVAESTTAAAAESTTAAPETTTSAKDCIQNSGFGLVSDQRNLWPYTNPYTGKDYTYDIENGKVVS